MEHDHVRLAEHFVKLSVSACLANDGFVVEDIVAENVHAHRLSDFGCLLTDTSHSEDTHCAAGELDLL